MAKAKKQRHQRSGSENLIGAAGGEAAKPSARNSVACLNRRRGGVASGGENGVATMAAAVA